MIDVFRAESPEPFHSLRELITDFVAWDTQVTSSLGLDASLLAYLIAHNDSHGTENHPQ